VNAANPRRGQHLLQGHLNTPLGDNFTTRSSLETRLSKIGPFASLNGSAAFQRRVGKSTQTHPPVKKFFYSEGSQVLISLFGKRLRFVVFLGSDAELSSRAICNLFHALKQSLVTFTNRTRSRYRKPQHLNDINLAHVFHRYFPSGPLVVRISERHAKCACLIPSFPKDGAFARTAIHQFSLVFNAPIASRYHQ
jgi:hypothetical protein